MKTTHKLIIAGLCLLFVGGEVFARMKEPKDGVLMPNPKQWNSEAVYIASHTKVSFDVALEVMVASRAVLLHAVIINTPGTSSSLRLYDMQLTTDTGNLIADIDTTSKGTLTYNIGLSSGMTIDNQAETPADVTISYLEY